MRRGRDSLGVSRHFRTARQKKKRPKFEPGTQSCGWRDSFMRWQAGEGHDDNDCLQLEWACLVTWA